ncbi:MAG TPA: glycosyltransferase family 39 protein [Pyrinomonadaceae bacterium]|nr:glycosyltransferase family 39 protein [Pyrinomonadaceae bacterium]
MNALLAVLSLALSCVVVFLMPQEGASALVMCAALALLVGVIIHLSVGDDRQFLTRLFVIALLLRMSIGTMIYVFRMQEFFGGDATTYDEFGYLLSQVWLGEFDYPSFEALLGSLLERNWGMVYLVSGIYTLTGRNMLAVQYFNSVVGAATVSIIFLCAHHIFQNLRVARMAALLTAFFPSMVLWSSQALKDGPIVLLLALSMLATLKLGERLSVKHFAVLAGALLALLTLRFYVFYMSVAAVLGALVIGMRRQSARSLVRQFIVMIGIGLVMSYFGVLREANTHYETFGDLDRIQLSRANLANAAQSGFGRDIDVSTTSGALTAIPVGMVYLLFAPFPWQLANLRQGITLPEMLVWWASFPLLVLGIYFTLKYRLRQALPILIFTTMLTLAYSIFQGNVGTAYRQRAQILVFYFIFVAVGYVLMKERQEEKKRQQQLMLQEARLRVRKQVGVRAAQATRERQAQATPRPAPRHT